MTKRTSTSTSETFAANAGRTIDHGASDTVLWRSPALSNGAPSVSHYRAGGASLMLLDTRRPTAWLLVDDDDAADALHALAPVPYLGALSVVLSDLVDDGADDGADDLVDQVAAQLTDDGSQATLPDGRIVRLRVETDECTTVDDEPDTYGRIAWCDQRARGEREAQRPEGFDGNAEKLGVGPSYDRCWWQPPTDGPRRGTEAFADERAHLLDLLAYGFVGYVVELCDAQPDRYGRLVVRESASLWGIDSRDVEAEIVAELVAEVLDV